MPVRATGWHQWACDVGKRKKERKEKKKGESQDGRVGVEGGTRGGERRNGKRGKQETFQGNQTRLGDSLEGGGRGVKGKDILSQEEGPRVEGALPTRTQLPTYCVTPGTSPKPSVPPFSSL